MAGEEDCDSLTHAIRDIPSDAGVVIVRCSSLGLFVDKIFKILQLSTREDDFRHKSPK